MSAQLIGAYRQKYQLQIVAKHHSLSYINHFTIKIVVSKQEIRHWNYHFFNFFLLSFRDLNLYQ